MHNVQSVQFLDRVERRGSGWNLCLQTLDGILCHDGEVHDQLLRPERSKTFAFLDEQMRLKIQDPHFALVPMTLEGCVVRLADTISYIGRDIEDAIRLGIVSRSELPRQCCRLLGDTNGTIVYHLVTDVIENSCEKDAIAFSPEISAALKELKSFNLERIYLNPRIKKRSAAIRCLFQWLFERYLNDLEHENRDSVIYSGFLDSKTEAYRADHRPAEIVRDFIAGMTDQYFLHQFPDHLRPKPLDL
jgi:dGTPase